MIQAKFPRRAYLIAVIRLHLAGLCSEACKSFRRWSLRGGNCAGTIFPRSDVSSFDDFLETRGESEATRRTRPQQQRFARNNGNRSDFHAKANLMAALDSGRLAPQNVITRSETNQFIEFQYSNRKNALLSKEAKERATMAGNHGSPHSSE